MRGARPSSAESGERAGRSRLPRQRRARRCRRARGRRCASPEIASLQPGAHSGLAARGRLGGRRPGPRLPPGHLLPCRGSWRLRESCGPEDGSEGNQLTRFLDVGLKASSGGMRQHYDNSSSSISPLQPFGQPVPQAKSRSFSRTYD
uniref:Uncharacterized protein n=1 Tax=Molossus molossus TaxID=27622 RepID=A0A7J8FYU0_MOLMO|nr:hypothetical protein HJG59_008186 [Molossus molossus]